MSLQELDLKIVIVGKILSNTTLLFSRLHCCVFIGDSNCGKTALLQSYTNKQFSPTPPTGASLVIELLSLLRADCVPVNMIVSKMCNSYSG